MTASLQTTRRGFLAGVSALSAAASGVFGLASAVAPAVAAVPAARGGAGWDFASARDLQHFVGHVFSMELDDGTRAPLSLVDVQAINSGPHRPAGLGRSEGAIMVFDFGSNEGLVEAGHRTYRISHAGIGVSDVFLGPVRRHTGGHYLEAVFN